MRTIQLANIIADHTGALREEALCFAWRILNEYPVELRSAALELAEGRIPSVEAGGISLASVMKASGVPDFYALELLRIISLDGETGKNLIFTLGARR